MATLPNDLQAECGALACVLASSNGEAERLLDQLSESDFHDIRNVEVFRGLVTLQFDDKPLTTVELFQILKDRASLDEAGGFEYVSQLEDATPSTANFPSFLETVKDRARRREMIEESKEIKRRALDISEPVINRKAAEPMGRIYKPSHLVEFKTSDDADSLIGQRWLCKRGKLLLVAPSGAGKSSLEMQMAISWAVNRDVFGIKSARPLRSVIIGDENDEGDLAEMFQGVCQHLEIQNGSPEFGMLESNLDLFHCPSIGGEQFLSKIERWLLDNPRDIAWLDPLVSYADVDITRQDGAAQFLRRGLSRIAESTGVIWAVIHHTAKTSKDINSKSNWKQSDFQYAGAGSYDLAGWARAAVTLDQVDELTYRLIFPKRGDRAGATHPNGEPTNVVWLRRALKGEGIHWQQVDEPEQKVAEQKEKPLTKPQQIATLNLGTFLNKCPADGEGLRAVIRRLTSWLASKDCPKRSLAQCSHGSLNTAVGLMLENEKLTMTENLYFKGPQA